MKLTLDSRKVRTLAASVLVGAFTLMTAASNAVAQSSYSLGHADIGIGYEDGELIPHWHVGLGAKVDGQTPPPQSEYAPEDLVAIVPNLPQARPASASFDPTGVPVLGVAAGESIWVLPKSGATAAGKPDLGLGAEEIGLGEWLGDTIVITLKSWTGPGHFALYNSNAGGSQLTDLLFSTYAPSLTLGATYPDEGDGGPWGENSYGLYAGGHEHYNWAFTAPGYYELTLEFSGTHLVDGEKTAMGTFGFHVIPEPSSVALIGVAVGGVLVSRIRRRPAR